MRIKTAENETCSMVEITVQICKRLAAIVAFGLGAFFSPGSAEAIFARYNPPFMPWFLRRNEVLIPAKPKTP